MHPPRTRLLEALTVLLASAGAAWAQPVPAGDGLPLPSGERRLPSASASLPKVLVTGFAPFGPWRTNPSWEAARRLQGAVISGHEVVAVELPVEYGRVWRALPRLLDGYRPAAVLHFGMNPAAGTPLVVERRARNGRYYTPDTARTALAPRCSAVVEEGPFWRHTTLPVRRLLDAFAAAGLPARESENAGYFLCEFTLFASLHHQAARGGGAPTGFVHVPGDWPLERIEAAMRLAVETTLEAPPAAAPPAATAGATPDPPDERLSVRGICDALRGPEGGP